MKKKVVIITGASSGLGRELAKIFIQNGSLLILSGRNKKKLLSLKNTNVEFVIGDLTHNETVEKITDLIVNKYKKVDILINNAGVGCIQPFEMNTLDQLDLLFEINVKSHMKLTQKLFPIMRRQQSGHIVNIISSAGLEGKFNHTLYCATKFALRGFTESLRLEAKRFKIKVTGIYPGGIKTHIFDKLAQKVDQSTFMNAKDVASAVYNVTKSKEICLDSLVISRMDFVKDPLYDNETYS